MLYNSFQGNKNNPKRVQCTVCTRTTCSSSRPINFDEVRQLCPGNLSGNINPFLSSLRSKFKKKNRNLPLYIIAQKVFYKFKDKPAYGPKKLKLREAIVGYYVKAGTTMNENTKP